MSTQSGSPGGEVVVYETPDGTVRVDVRVEREATVAKSATVQREGDRDVVREIECFNLDAIISVGYRVNSKRGTQFRIWATRMLRDLRRPFALPQRPGTGGAPALLFDQEPSLR